MPNFRTLRRFPVGVQDGRLSRRQVLAGAVALGVGGASCLALRAFGTIPNLAPPQGGARHSLSAGNGPLRCVGANLVDQAGQDVDLTGVNWFGLETGTFCPHGLWARNWQDMLDQIVQTGFNTLRLPYSNQLFEAASTPNGIDFTKNADLRGLTGLEIMDRIILGAGQRGLKVILDRHRPDAYAQSPLWYTDHVSEERWIADWVMLARRYRSEPSVIGADLHNEPHGPATWGDGNMTTDWRLAAERAGNAILAANPDWLIVVEGIERFADDWYWWGGNLLGARHFPVRLMRPDKLVYSAHDYGPGVSGQAWFSAPTFPNNLPDVWQTHWAYLRQDGIAPVWLGEFGGRSMGTDPEGVWQRRLVAFLKQQGISYAYWAWNPNSGDTGGILEPDWQTVDQTKLHILSAYQWPLLGQPTRRPGP
jgi:endoglucanase